MCDGEGFWCCVDDDGGFYDVMLCVLMWLMVVFVGDECECEDDDVCDDELGCVVVLVVMGMGEGCVREVFARDVAGALRFAWALECVCVDGVERMWMMVYGDGLRMWFDGVVWVDGEVGEWEVVAVSRERLLREAKYARGEYYVVLRSCVVE